MKANVIKPYIDRETGVLHAAGEAVELTDSRAAELAEGGFVKAEEAPKSAAKAAPKRKPAAKKAAQKEA